MEKKDIITINDKNLLKVSQEAMERTALIYLRIKKIRDALEMALEDEDGILTEVLSIKLRLLLLGQSVVIPIKEKIGFNK